MTNKRVYLLLFIAFIIRIIIFLTYAPIGYADTGWYEKLAKEILSWDFSNYDGARTPVYPIILILGFIRWKVVWIIQLLTGIINSLLVYSILKKATKNEKFSFVGGVLYNFSIIILFFESNLLTETTCIFFLLLSAIYFQKITGQNQPGSNVKNLIFLSLFISLAALTRPTFAYIFPLAFLLIALSKKTVNLEEYLFKGTILKYLIIYSVPFIILVGGWSVFNKVKVDYLGPTTLTGFHLIEHSGAFIENAPEEYSDLKEVYLRNRKLKIEETGDQTCTIYMVYPEIQKNKGYSIATISKELTAVSLWLFWNYPALYLQSVLRAFGDYWFLPNFIEYWDLNKIRYAPERVILDYMIKAELYLWLLLNMLFIVSGAYYLYLFFKKKFAQSNMLILYLYFSVMILSLIQAFVQYGDNWRFSVAVKPYMMLALALSIYNIFFMEKKFK